MQYETKTHKIKYEETNCTKYRRNYNTSPILIYRGWSLWCGYHKKSLHEFINFIWWMQDSIKQLTLRPNQGTQSVGQGGGVQSSTPAIAIKYYSGQKPPLGQHQAAADSKTKPTNSVCGLISSIPTSQHCHLVLLSPKADDTRSTISWKAKWTRTVEEVWAWPL